jgi:predicted transcriptional regulator with HTH domain
MKQLSEKMFRILERLAEMFPKQHYQSELERYVLSKKPTNTAEFEYWANQYSYDKHKRGIV